ncbi:pyridoxamine 5'-phosphate oxidase family protein [Paenibacillus barengoltzii]|jgi:general stress protein 26|uniref:General stress protein 26 n=1 Tax=Paenibacillus barengoltzii J12 TaxID=935846 RepID=A0ABY1M1S1_9BACL|nr:pyridoxamine 5'-phosphate oxidase family protein [Paenibacillus barengoltzii]SMF56038.1 General stress protein 26 [Paenibacillus barengoltzii J12]
MTVANHQTAHQEAVETVRKLIKGIEIAMLTTVTKEGLVSRPMKTQEVEFDGDLWFLTKEETDKYSQLKDHPHVNVSYVGDSYVSVRGTAEVVNDREKIKQFWNAAYAKFLHTTSDDPNLVLIKVKAEAAEYWETGNLVKVIKRMFSQLTGKETEAELNKTVKL